jgi:molecular chaperone DnaK
MYLGIDFGTSFSQMATLYLDQPLLLLHPGEYGIPSEFYYDRDCGVLVGQDASDAGQGLCAANLVSEVKMNLSGSFTLDGRKFAAQDIIREIYRTLVTRAQQIARTKSIDENIRGVVISVPAKFDYLERKLIYDAAVNCMEGMKLPVRDIIKEPVAAALAYYNTSLENGKNILVYDLGGGTCDVALVHSDDTKLERFEVIDSSMVRIGGRNWDEKLEEYLAAEIQKKADIIVKGNPGYEEKVRRAAINAKHQLSDNTRDKVFARIEINGRIISVMVTRRLFEELTQDLLMQTISCLEDVFYRNYAKHKIDEIICVGGSSNMLQVPAKIRESFPECNVRIFEPEHAVVNGTAIYADMLGETTSPGTVLQDISNFSYGVQAYKDYHKDPNYLVIFNLLRKGEELPVVGYKSLSPISNTQHVIGFQIFESEYGDAYYPADVTDKRLIGRLDITLSPDSTIYTKINCKMSLNSAGLLEFSAEDDKGNHCEQTFHVSPL